MNPEDSLWLNHTDHVSEISRIFNLIIHQAIVFKAGFLLFAVD